ncbi:hypothetical protein BG004_006383 [Podila humilis]|nr:hypothetical protein BG004_006383 [Podila humilis]
MATTAPTPSRTGAATTPPTGTTNYILPTTGPGPAAGGNQTIFHLPTGTVPFNSNGGGGGPNDPNFPRPSGPTTTDNSSKIGMIVGITVAGVAVLAMVGLLFQRYQAHSRTNTLNSHQTRSRPSKKNQTGAAGSPHNNNQHLSDEERGGDRAKLAKSFTIRKPPSVYVDDDQDLDQTGHPRYKSDSDARNHPYYGDRRTPGLIEYELTDTSGQKYGPSSIADRKRYVEQQQRKVMDEYEMFNPHRDQSPPPSPYPPSSSYQSTAAPSYVSAAAPPPPGNSGAPLSPTMAPSMTPSMGGRSPRIHHPAQSQMSFGRSLQSAQDDYKY